MKTKTAKRNVYRAFTEFEKAFLPESYKTRISRVPTAEQSATVRLANEFVEAVQESMKRKPRAVPRSKLRA